MAYTNINISTNFFNTVLNTGNGSTQSITGVGFQPDFVWGKRRDSTGGHNQLYDAVRGVHQTIYSDGSWEEGTNSDALTSFDSDGFSAGGNGDFNSANNYCYWNWKAGTTTGIATNGSTNITPTGYSFNQTSGFSIVKWNGTAVDGAYLPHGLGKAPELVLLKCTSHAESWNVYSKPMGSGGRLHLNNSDAVDTSRGEWYSTTPDSVNIRISNDSHINGSGYTYVAYFFTSIAGYCSIGKFLGTGSTSNSPFIYTGMRPSFLLLKKTSGTGDYFINDVKRNPSNVVNTQLYPNLNTAEEISKIKKKLNQMYADHTGQPLKVINEAMERDKFMSPEEALDFGLVDKIITHRSDVE